MRLLIVPESHQRSVVKRFRALIKLANHAHIVFAGLRGELEIAFKNRAQVFQNVVGFFVVRALVVNRLKHFAHECEFIGAHSR